MTMKTHSKKLDFKELAEQYSLQIEGWHLFYESFIKFEHVLMTSKGVLVEMYSEAYKAKNKGNTRAENALKRIDVLRESFENLEGLNNRCMNLQRQLKKSVSKSLQLEEENKKLINELEAIKKAHNE